MTNTILANIVAEYIKKVMPDYVVKATPIAPFAPTEYLLPNQTEILVWVENNPAYQAELAVMDNYRFMPYIDIQKSYKLVISVGHKSHNEDTVIDDMGEEIETHLTNLQINRFAPLMPRPNTAELLGKENSKWKQLYFETMAIFNVTQHTTED